MAMGSPISFTLANLVMEDVEQRALNTCASPPAFWKRYVDDTFTVLPRGHVQQSYDHLNSTEPTIKFTIEMEQEGSLPFLDTRVTRNSDGSLTTTVFRKKTHSDRYLDFDSHHPLAHKVAVARTLITQADWICVSVLDRDVEKRRITGALSSNCYPTALVKKNWHQRPTPLPPLELDTPKAVVVIPTEDPYLFQTTPDSETDTGQFEGPGPSSAGARSNLQDPLQWLPQSVCRPDRQNIGPTTEGTQACSIVSGHLAQSAVAEHAAQELHDGCSAAVSPEMPAGIVAHPI